MAGTVESTDRAGAAARAELGPIRDRRCLIDDMAWLVALGLCVTVVFIVTAVFVASVRNARALRQDLNERFDGVQARLEKQANALTDELLARRNDSRE
jgi:sensor domain CHASE-containing protein